ncbi:MAG: hypothetical protein HY821_18035 [Acidobacteria bacterium]|nr:hypothetical protein [Acidobacteriota bacterium]
MKREDFIRRLVLDKICDDYENIDQTILRDVASDAAEFGLAVERSDVVRALTDLIGEGLVKAYLLSRHAPYVTEMTGMPAVERAEEEFGTYFLATQQGIDLQLSDDSWWPSSAE